MLLLLIAGGGPKTAVASSERPSMAGFGVPVRTGTAPEDAFDPKKFDQAYFLQELKKMYKRKMLPLELGSKYSHFSQSPPLGPADFEAKPMVLLIGQYSVGKTSFIRSLLGRDFPGQRIGPEPTTDRFVAVMHGDQDRTIPGNALAMRADRPFCGLQGFGNSFLEKLQGAELDAPILRNITLVDTPGVLSGEKQRQRDYDFQAVVRWFADRSDLIVLMFDAHKLDISDELRATIDALRPHYAKLRVVLNKADAISPQQLLRVYGALMWQLGRVVASPEVVRVHLGSFSGPARPSMLQDLLLTERADLVAEMVSLPKHAVIRKINDLSKRGRFLKVHCYLIHYLRKQMPYVFGKDEKRTHILNNLHHLFQACAHRYGLSLGDFPDVLDFRAALAQIQDIRAFPKLDKTIVADMDKMFAVDIPRLLDKASLH
ncbi:hypothetical protein CTAYLR_004624 [Chrysophaeum taylorii]|uniref:Dynamin-type G domain-containing protein n=1 Tax=Chrysophaeum taylorii TaxID=2483200 RepID=A0AAD7XS04_9STRA|nr:hypothetical protein CTAYLR_004624 [Chrysophaeum taylorii]